MITIVDTCTGNEYKLYGATMEFATKDSFIVDREVGNTFRQNWKCIIEMFIPMGKYGTQCLLSSRFAVKNK